MGRIALRHKASKIREGHRGMHEQRLAKSGGQAGPGRAHHARTRKTALHLYPAEDGPWLERNGAHEVQWIMADDRSRREKHATIGPNATAVAPTARGKGGAIVAGPGGRRKKEWTVPARGGAPKESSSEFWRCVGGAIRTRKKPAHYFGHGRARHGQEARGQARQLSRRKPHLARDRDWTPARLESDGKKELCPRF